MLEWMFNWRRSLFIGLLLLLVVSSFLPPTRQLGAGWWVEQQRLPDVAWQTVQRTVTVPAWYGRFQAIIGRWRVGMRGGLLIWLVCHLLTISAVVWVWLLRWVISQMIGQEVESIQGGSWGWAGPLANSSATIQVQLMVLVSPDLAEEAVSTAQAKRLLTDEAEIVVEDRLVGPALVSLPAPSGSWEQTDETLLECLDASQPQLKRPMLIESQPSTVAVEELKAESRPGELRKESLPPRNGAELHTPEGAISQHFSKLDDPRVDRTKKHRLLDIVTIAICAVISGADTWVDVETFGWAKLDWFKTFLELPNGIPSHDTFGRVFSRLDAEQFQTCFLEWIQAAYEVTQGQIVPIDGKNLRRSHDKTLGKNAIHMVSAWASENRLVLGQIKVDEKSNEITAIPALLDVLAISGCIVTIDAMGCQKKIAKKIVDKGADYTLAVKKNQKGLYDDIVDLFDYAQETDFADCDYHKTVNKGHGRIEIRKCWTISDPEYLVNIRNLSAWKGLQTIVMVRAERRIGEKSTIEVRYYISSLAGDAQLLLKSVRGHWGIENQVHWVLDVVFREDDCRIRKGNGAQNFAVLRHIALNLLTQEETAKCGTKAKRLKAGWDESYLIKVLSGFT